MVFGEEAPGAASLAASVFAASCCALAASLEDTMAGRLKVKPLSAALLLLVAASAHTRHTRSPENTVNRMKLRKISGINKAFTHCWAVSNSAKSNTLTKPRGAAATVVVALLFVDAAAATATEAVVTTSAIAACPAAEQCCLSKKTTKEAHSGQHASPDD